MHNIENDKDFANLLRDKAAAGDPEYLFRVGQCYFHGINIEKNYYEALKWYMLAADKEHSTAQNNIGVIYADGLGVEKDIKEALRWYERAVKQANCFAQRNLAYCYAEGRGVAQDYAEALRLYTLAAEQGYWLASKNLGDLNYCGVVVEQDLLNAKMHYEKALADSDFPIKPAKEEDKNEIRDLIEEISNIIAEAEEKAEAARKTERTDIFVSYAHKDMEYLVELRTHLQMLENTNNITWWDDKNIQGGDKWDEEIKEALSKAKVAILLVSANFFASEYIWKEELPKALENGADILWVLVSSCAYEGTILADYQAMGDLQKPLTKCERGERDDVYTNIVRRVKSIYKI